MPQWQREYERDWRDVTRREIAHHFGAYALQCAPSVTPSDEQLLQDVLMAAGVAHVPLSPSHWTATRPLWSPSLVDDASYVFSTPPPVDEIDEFPAFSSADFRAHAASKRRKSASQRLQLRLADVSPLVGNTRRSSMERAATISPLAAVTSPWTSGQWSTAGKTRQKTRRVSLESSFRDKELDLSMHSMHLSDEEGCGDDEVDGVCVEDEGSVEATQVIEVLVDDDNEEKGVAMPGRDGDKEVERVQKVRGVDVDVDAGDLSASRWLELCKYNEDKDMVQKDVEEKNKQVYANAVVEERDGNTDAPFDVSSQGDLVASGELVEEPVWHAEADIEFGTGDEYDNDSQRFANGVRDAEMRQLSQRTVKGLSYTVDALQTVAEPEREDTCDRVRQQDIAATSKPVDSPSSTKNMCAARQHDPVLTGQSTSALSEDSVTKKAVYVSTTAPSASEGSCTTTTALSTDQSPTALPLASLGNDTAPATSSALPATRALHTPAVRSSANEAAQRSSTTTPALRRSVVSRKRATRGALLHTKLPLQMEYRFASDRRRRHKRRKSSAMMPGVFPFVVPELAIELKSYQKEALRWMLEREQEPGDTITVDRQQHGATTAVDALVAKVRGGILADEMGLGKTVCCLALICASLRQARTADAQSSNETGSTVPRITPPTLIVTPLSILSQWEQEIRAKTNLSVVTYQGAARKNFRSSTQFMGTDIVLSTYDTLRLSECKVRGKGSEGSGRNGCGAEDGWHQAPRLVPRLQKSVATSRLHQLEWFRVILDESHLIANAGCGRARAAFTLNGRRRWCVTGTPIQNRTADLAALLQFVGLGARAHALSERELGLMVPRVVLRRLKSTVDMWSKAPILELPGKSETTIELDFASDIERALYMLLYRSTKRQVLRYLQSKEAKQKTRQASCTGPANIDKERPLFMHVFELILRLRQVCNSCALVTADPWTDVRMRVEKLAGNEGPDGMSSFSHADAELLKRFQKQRSGANGDFGHGSLESTKLTALIKELKRVRANRERALVISQWTSFLDIIGERLDVHNAECETRYFGDAQEADHEAITFAKLDGRMSAKDREQVVRNFQQQEDSFDGGSSIGPPLDVLLLSLRTGGLGLNLTAAAHVFIMEPSWNPSLEHQAIDRAHRFGQTKQVRVIRFVVKGSIEERVMALQTKKCQLTAAFLGDGETASSAKPNGRLCKTRLSTRDIRTLFLTQQEQVEVVDLHHLDGIRGHARDDEAESSDRSVTCIEISD
ncbi:unnamed protein product [Hyaloperonospora brassicae]|uniref:Helicase ATP-binding domain-containing protein n=1 Tax=Hyaloperonospora brassicae TaxID=162125 RepID=A0AAV0TS19_HYABA|nr:unnamed protein product [Hyaloperonospora brassicae]